MVRRVSSYATESERRLAIIATKRRWRASNPEAMAAARRNWKKNNPESVRAQRRQHKKRDPISNRAYVRARKARKKSLSTVPFTAEQLRQRLEFYGGCCWMCGAPGDITIDHVKPLAAGGAHMLCNLRPACSTCNAKKGAKWPYPLSSPGDLAAPTGLQHCAG